MTVDQLWVDFLGITSNKNRPMPFVEAIPLRLWICTPMTNVPIETSIQSSQSSLDYERDSYYRKGSVDSNPIPQPTSATSSPGCQRAHHVSIPSSVHASVSSPNLKTIPKDELGTTGGQVELIGSPPVISSLPSSPRLRDSGFSSLSESKVTSQSPSINCTSQNSSNSLHKVASGEVPVLQENSEDCVTLDQKSSHNSLDGKMSPMCIFKARETEISNKAPGHIPNGGSNMSVNEGPNELRKAFGSFSSNEDDNIGAFPMDEFKVADMSVLAVVPVNVSAQLDHFQFIFLMRLQEMMVKLQEQLDQDRQNHIAVTCDKPSQSSPRVTFSVLAKSAEVNIILPPSPDPALNSRGTSSTSSYLDPGFVSDNESASPEVLVDNIKDKPGSQTPDVKTSLSTNDVTSGIEGRGSALSMCESTDGWLPQDGDKNAVANTRRGSDASCSSSQLGTSVDSRSRSSSRSARSGRIVSVFTAEGNDIHFGLLMDGDDMTVKLTSQEIKVDEKGNLNFEKYLNQKSFKPPQDSNTTVPRPLPSSPPMVNVRAEFGPGAERNTPSAGELGFAHVQMSNVGLSLLMSNIESLSECFDDEILLPKMPFYVEMKSSNICLKDDKPPRLLSTPTPLPLNVSLENISIFRNQNEVINIRALNASNDGTEPSVGEPVALHTSHQLSRTTSDLSLAESMSSRSDNDSERECLKAQLSVSRAALHAVQDERQALLKTIERLQYELSMSNREQDRLQAKVVAYQSVSGRRK